MNFDILSMPSKCPQLCSQNFSNKLSLWCHWCCIPLGTETRIYVSQ